MSARISWFSIENSFNPFDQHQESSPILVRNNQNSISFVGKYSSFPRQQESRSLRNFHLLFDNFLNKNDSLMSRQDKFTFELIFKKDQQPFVEESSSQNGSDISESQLEIPDFELKKGLKNLAKLLMKILRKKKFDSSKNLTAEIQQILMKGKKLSKNELSRESKNIRRRTYDALNVMVAANVLGPDLAFVKRINTSSFTRKCGAFVGEKKQLANKNEQIQQRIQKKKYLLKKLKSKKSAVEWWIQKKKRQSQNITLSLQQNFQFFKNSHRHSCSESRQKIFLPVIFVPLADDACMSKFEKTDQNSVVIKPKSGELKLFSEIDAFQILKSQEQVLQESPFQFQKSKHLDFRSLELPEKEKNEGDFFFKFSVNERQN